MEILISIIIPVYNVEKYLGNCLESIAESADQEKTEVLVIDDGSPDRSGEIADNYAGKYPFIKVVHQKNAGVAAARNTGIAMARGEWLYFADSDDWLVEGAIGRLLQRCAEDQGSDILLFDAWKNAGDKEEPWEHFRDEAVWDTGPGIRVLQRGTLYFPSAGKATKVPLAAPWDKLYRREFLARAGIQFLPELKVLDDMVFNMEAFGQAKRVSYYKDKIYHYRVVPESITNSYKADRVAQDGKVWEYLAGYMGRTFGQNNCGEAEKEQFEQAYYCRVIKSFSICCRLSFFNPSNRNGFRDKLRYVEEVLGMEPYKTAFSKVKMKNAEWRLKAVICMGRCRSGMGIYLLHVAQNLLKLSLFR